MQRQGSAQQQHEEGLSKGQAPEPRQQGQV